MPRTTLSVDATVQRRLRKLGKKGMSDNAILKVLLTEAEKKQFFEGIEAQLKSPKTRWIDLEDVQWDD